MANVKISALTADAAPTADDLVVTVNDPGGTPATRKATITNFTKAIPAVVGDSGAGGTKGLVPAPGAGDAAAGKFLKADGTFAVPAGAGGTGYINIPQNSQSADYTAVLSDEGKHLFHPVGDNNPRTFTIPANASVAYAIGTAITFVNKINTLTIAITSDTLTWADDGSTGSRTLAANGVATAIKITSTEWIISGTGLS